MSLRMRAKDWSMSVCGSNEKSAANEEGVEIRLGGRDLAQKLRSELLRFFLLLFYSVLTGKKRLLIGEGGIAG